MIVMSKIPGFKREFQRNLKDLMIRPYRAVIEENLK